MEPEPILAASVTGVLAFAGVVWQARKGRRLNTDEHEQNANKLDRIEELTRDTAGHVRAVSERLDDHIKLHETRKGRWRK
jgi:hypothetical protein